MKVYDTSIMDGKLVCTHKCDDIPFDMCYAYGMNNIYVAFGQYVVLYEMKNRGLEFNELERIPVEGTVIGIAKTLDGLYTANDSSKTFRWDDFSIKSDQPYAKEGNKPFICSSFRGEEVAYIKDHKVIVTDIEGKKLSESVCSLQYPKGLSFDSDNNIIVCSFLQQAKQIKNGGKQSRNIDIMHHYSPPSNVVFHPEGHKLICFYLNYYLCIYQIM